MSQELAKLITKTFVSRTDVKAIQRDNGDYNPIREPWKMDDLVSHLNGTQTFGHYLVGKDDQCKLFCFDVDIQPVGWLPTVSDPEMPLWENYQPSDVNLRDEWLNRKSIYRTLFKRNFHYAAHQLAATIKTELQIKTAVAYSGAKGVHVYGIFPHAISAGDARIGAQLVLEKLDCFEQYRGEHMFKHKDPNNEYWMNLNIEIYPKQDSLSGKDLGNLLRLPLGVNRKSSDPTFFIDLTEPMNTLTALDPVYALTMGDPFKKLGE